jgi:hypothetical protein
MSHADYNKQILEEAQQVLEGDAGIVLVIKTGHDSDGEPDATHHMIAHMGAMEVVGNLEAMKLKFLESAFDSTVRDLEVQPRSKK